MIDFLYSSNLLTQEQNKTLQQYREKRNQVMHDLVSQIATEQFEKELREICELGDKITQNESFKMIEHIIDELEEGRYKSKTIEKPVIVPQSA